MKPAKIEIPWGGEVEPSAVIDQKARFAALEALQDAQNAVRDAVQLITEARKTAEKDPKLLAHIDRWAQEWAVLLAGNRSAGAPVLPIRMVSSDRGYRVGMGHLLSVTRAEDRALRAFIGRPVLDTQALIKHSGDPHADRVIRQLRRKYDGAFEAAIRLAGKKGTGGYQALVIPV